MKMQITAHHPLQVSVPASQLFGDWMAGRLDASFLKPEHRAAGRELDQALDTNPRSGIAHSDPAPLFRSSWTDSWAGSFAADLPDDASRSRFKDQLASLKAGTSDVVVTGQQPGYLGGPLYTLYKVATTVALARRRSAAGHPTIPVFWSGDDDDDLAEALAPVGWDPSLQSIRRSPGVPRAQGNIERPAMLGRRAGEPWMEAAASWLEGLNSRDGAHLGKAVSDILQEAVSDQWSWSRVARRLILRVFSGQGLVVLSGDDPGMHAAAQAFYEDIIPRLDALGDLAAARGRELESGGWHAQITDRSLARPLFVVDGDRRVPLEPGVRGIDSSRLRPGVMLRSPLQDWLLRPAAVVVGPGELAYLRQLDPIYEQLGVGRPPLVPRLFSWLLPPGFDEEQLRAFREGKISDPSLADRLADEAEEKAHEILTVSLKTEVGVDQARAEALAAGRSRRWRKGVAAMFRAEIERVRLERVPAEPVWVFPDGLRQERHLAYGAAVVLWGEDLVAACIEAAEEHLEYGSRGDWREFIIEVPEPNDRKD